MRSGPNRFEITIERRIDTQTSSGLSFWYESIGEDFAAIRALSGRELFTAQQVQSEVSVEIRIRWRPDVDETCRVVHVVDPDSPSTVDLYDITSVLPDAKTGRRELVLLCTKRRAEGWRSGGDSVAPGALLTEEGDVLLTESGDQIVT